MSWLLSSSYYSSEVKEPTQPERDCLISIILHLIFCTSYCVPLPKHKCLYVPCDSFWMIFLWIIHVIHCSAATSCTAVMSTSLVSSLLLYRHRKVSVNHPRVCLAVIPLGAVTFKVCLCSPSVHQYCRRLINRMSFHACLLECNSHLMSHTHLSLTPPDLTWWSTNFHVPVLLRAWAYLSCAVMWYGSQRKFCSGTKTLASEGAWRKLSIIPSLCSPLTLS